VATAGAHFDVGRRPCWVLFGLDIAGAVLCLVGAVFCIYNSGRGACESGDGPLLRHCMRLKRLLAPCFLSVYRVGLETFSGPFVSVREGCGGLLLVLPVAKHAQCCAADS
jgi:hypothetical protein